MDIEERLAKLEQLVAGLQIKRVDKTGIIPGSIQQLHMSNTAIIQYGVDADLPVAGTNSILCFYATDTKKLYLWNPATSVWNHVQFS